MSHRALQAAALASLAGLAASLGQSAIRVKGYVKDHEMTDAGDVGSGNSLHGALKGFPAPDQIFRQYDRNTDGKLTGDEISSLLKSLGFNGEETDQMKNEMDRNMDAQVSPKEFKNYLMVPLGAEDGEQGDPAAPMQLQATAVKRPVEHPREANLYQSAPQQAAAAPAAAMPGTAEAPTLDEMALSAAAPDAAAAAPAQQAAGAQLNAVPAAAREAAPQAASAAGAAVSPFGKEDTAQELQMHSTKTQDTLIDAIENAEVAEIKRAVFRALTRLRAAQIKEFDTIARLETQAIDEYNDNHHYRSENPPGYLSNTEPAIQADKTAAFH